MVRVRSLSFSFVTMFSLGSALLAQSIPNWTAPRSWTPPRSAAPGSSVTGCEHGVLPP